MSERIATVGGPRGCGGDHVAYPAFVHLGTVELTQDLTPLRALDGERRLLQYASPAAVSNN